jgi:hypothetical protein
MRLRLLRLTRLPWWLLRLLWLRGLRGYLPWRLLRP